MHVMLMTYGTRGDVQPFVALGRGLIQKGHRVTVAAPERFAGFVTDHDLEFAALTDALIALMDDPQFAHAFDPKVSALGKLRSLFAISKKARSLQETLLDDIFRAIDQAKPDVIVFHPKTFGALPIGRHFGIPVVMAQLIPSFIPTGDYPHMGVPDLGPSGPLGSWYNRVTGKLIYRLLNATLRRQVQRWAARRQNGINTKGLDILQSCKSGTLPIIHAFSNAVINRPKDWPKHATVTGYWFLDTASQTNPPDPALQNFVESHKNLIYIGFGSMHGNDPTTMAEMIAEAGSQADVSAIVATGWGGMDNIDWPANILAVREVPHDWLFPKVDIAIHHGGAGTCAAALRAGRPSIIIPFFGDQPFWAKCLHRLGVAPRPIKPAKLDTAMLASRIKTVLETPSYRNNAERVASKIAAEDGIANAIAEITRATEQSDLPKTGSL
ncbi:MULTISPECIES: glycosyltransferase [unclassified Thalassospira]|uniref:glycosyltransferase n=1 Tax=unclassified Thalassospira TaxID=2648997 RepID=UPI0007A58A3C|nr:MULTISPECIES: glycosyltransferase [unclassified Thalassospira]KZD00353.1 glycosyl transferase family 2 [Thalassospira sp. MCCC 1A02898]ONH86989.1 UDP-glucose:sterol glucosyltransferase [Thalassospira sp. MCCC 1A02803]